MRREVESYFPKAYILRSLNRLDKNQITKPERKGYKNTALLHEAFEIPSQREEIIAATGLEETFAEEIFSLSDITRTQWASPKFSKLPVDAGFKNAKSIAQENAKELHEAIEKIK